MHRESLKQALEEFNERKARTIVIDKQRPRLRPGLAYHLVRSHVKVFMARRTMDNRINISTLGRSRHIALRKRVSTYCGFPANAFSLPGENSITSVYIRAYILVAYTILRVILTAQCQTLGRLFPTSPHLPKF